MTRTQEPFAVRRRAEIGAVHVAGLSLLAVAGAAATGLAVEILYGEP